MKNLLILFLVVLGKGAIGQTSLYRPFPTTNGEWIYCYTFNIPYPKQKDYILKEDTSISNIAYKKIFVDGFYKGALRESSKKIYIVPDTSLNEYVLYDFNLTVGDTIKNPVGGAICSNGPIVINAVDSVLASDGYHRSIRFIYGEWIEGIGSKHYLLNPVQYNCLGGNDNLEFVQNDSTFDYTSYNPTCATSTSVGLGENLQTILHLFPNPLTFEANLSISEEIINGTIYIYNHLGEIVQELNNVQGAAVNLKRENLSAGLYFLYLKDKTRRSTLHKLVITE